MGKMDALLEKLRGEAEKLKQKALDAQTKLTEKAAKAKIAVAKASAAHAMKVQAAAQMKLDKVAGDLEEARAKIEKKVGQQIVSRGE